MCTYKQNKTHQAALYSVLTREHGETEEEEMLQLVLDELFNQKRLMKKKQEQHEKNMKRLQQLQHQNVERLGKRLEIAQQDNDSDISEEDVMLSDLLEYQKQKKTAVTGEIVNIDDIMPKKYKQKKTANPNYYIHKLDVPFRICFVASSVSLGSIGRFFSYFL